LYYADFLVSKLQDLFWVVQANPLSSLDTHSGDLAQSVERLNGIQKVTGAKPVISTSKQRPAAAIPDKRSLPHIREYRAVLFQSSTTVVQIPVKDKVVGAEPTSGAIVSSPLSVQRRDGLDL